jgi:predicted RNase H-like nuclease (RuvC/YqgF family)
MFGSRFEVKKLQLELEALKKEHELEKKLQEKWRSAEIEELKYKQLTENERTTSEMKLKLAKSEEAKTQLEGRLKDAPYSQLTDLLKALVVKFPTLNISELSVKVKEK